MTLSSTPSIVLYGSYGYSGNLIAERAAERGIPLLLAGRNAEKLREQAERLKLPWKAASLDHPEELDALLHGKRVVLHAAGPFVHTWKPMLRACLRNGCHYADITGEVDVFEGCKMHDSKLKKAGIAAMPGTGFDVVPTDCVAKRLSEECADADHLELAFMGVGGGVSHGTAQTVTRQLGEGALIRRDGELTRVPAAWKTRTVSFGSRTASVTTIPWGDVSTAYTTTGIPNITVYMAMPRNTVRAMKLSNWLAPLLRTRLVKSSLSRWIRKNVEGPGKEARETGRSLIWGRVTGASGAECTAHLETSEAYHLTAVCALEAAVRLADDDHVSGYCTPAGHFGSSFIEEVDQVTIHVESTSGD
ncbi:MAG: saccharopine dehydrogenase family protein [Balneolaceae bacterium]